MRSTSRAQLIAGFAAIYLLWGGSFLGIRYAVREVPPLLTIAIRCAGGAAILLAWLALRGKLERTSREQWRAALLTGTLLFLGCHAVLAWGEQRVPSGQAALLLAGIPLWLTLLEARRTSRWPGLRVWLGLGLGLGGVGLLAARAPATGDLLARGALVLCGLSWAVGSLIARDGERPSSSAQATAMQLIAGAVVVGTLSGVLGEWKEWHPGQLTARAALALVFLSVCGTAIAFGAYTWLLQVASPTLVGTYAFVNPVVALGLAWLTGDEKASYMTAAAAGLILGAVLLTTRRKDR